jgi:hypothetical protein
VAAALKEIFSVNLIATPILDYQTSITGDVAAQLSVDAKPGGQLLQAAHRYLVSEVRPVYSVNEFQPASITLRLKCGSCSQRMACLEAVSRACGIPSRSRALHVSGRFWYPRFRTFRAFIPKRILLIWPQFFIEDAWIDFDEIYASAAELAKSASHAFRNDGESVFDAVEHTAVDFMSKTCGEHCSRSRFDLSKYVLADHGFYNTRDEVFERYGSFQASLRGRMFELIYGGRDSV